MTDLSSILLDPIYTDAFIGCPAIIDTGSTVGPVAVTAIDETAGTEINSSGMGGTLMLQTIRPCAKVRTRELIEKGLAPADLNGGTIELHSGTSDAKTWAIESHQLLPTQQGELAGEVLLILTDTVP